MIPEESIWIKKIIMNLKDIKQVLDLGSNTSYYREVRQSYIDKNIFYPLRLRGANIDYFDIKKEEGVNLVGDISKSSFSLDTKYDLVICANVLENVNGSLKSIISNILSTIKDCGNLIITSVYWWPYDAFPNDNLLRLSKKKLKNLFSSLKLERIELIRHKKRNIFKNYSLFDLLVYSLKVPFQKDSLSRKIRGFLQCLKFLFLSCSVSCAHFRLITK